MSLAQNGHQGRADVLSALAIPATAMPADALAWVEPVRTGAVPIPMISGFAPPVATGIGLGGQQDSDGQDRRGGKEHSKLTHGFLPLESSSSN